MATRRKEPSEAPGALIIDYATWKEENPQEVTRVQKMSNLDLHNEQMRLDSKLGLGTLGADEACLDQCIRQELERRRVEERPSHYRVGADNTVTKEERPKKMAMFDPAGSGLG